MALLLGSLPLATGCPEPPPEQAGTGGTGGEPGCAIIGGAGTAPELVAFGQMGADGAFEELVEGSVVDLVRPIQGGQVIFVAARVRGICPDDVEIRGRIRDPRSGNYLAEDRRTHIDLRLAEDGSWGEPAWERISDTSNVPVCPNFLGREMAGPDYELEIRMGPKEGPWAEGTLTVSLGCRRAQGDELLLCQCECAADYEFGKCE